MPDALPTRSGVVWALRVVFFAGAVACVYFLGGREWFFGGLMLGWLWAVLEVAAQPSRYPVFPDEAEYDGEGGGPVGY